MEEEFFASLKLTTGEELISKVSYMADQDTLILDRPMVVEKIIQKRGNRAIEGFHLREWMTATYENLFYYTFASVSRAFFSFFSICIQFVLEITKLSTDFSKIL